MHIEQTALPEVKRILPRIHKDNRGHFLEMFNASTYAEITNVVERTQDNSSRSSRGVIRGLHLQWPRPQGKLISVVFGKIFDVAVDVRKGSPTFGQWVGEILDDINCQQLWIPPGFAHGFQAISEEAIIHYKCSAHFYSPKTELSIRYNDPDIGINWPLPVTYSHPKDSTAPLLRECVNLPQETEL